MGRGERAGRGRKGKGRTGQRGEGRGREEGKKRGGVGLKPTQIWNSKTAYGYSDKRLICDPP